MKFLKTYISGKFLASLCTHGMRETKVLEGFRGEVSLVHTQYDAERKSIALVWSAPDDPRATEVPEGASIMDVPEAPVVLTRVL